MKPKPLESLNHFTVPVAITVYLYEKPRESGRDGAGHEESRVGCTATTSAALEAAMKGRQFRCLKSILRRK